MTDFNALPLAEQLKQLQPGDELHLRGGGWLPFRRIISQAYLASGDDEVMWKLDGNLYTKGLSNQMDIIRVVRHPARKVPEVVGEVERNHTDYELGYREGYEQGLDEGRDGEG